MNRRMMLRSLTALGTLAAVSGCGMVSVTTENSKTTVAIDVAKIDAYAQAAWNATQLILELPGLPLNPALTSAIITIGGKIAADILAFDQANMGQVVMRFDRSDTPALVTSLLVDCQAVLSTLRGANSIKLNSTVTAYINALSTVVLLFQAQLSFTRNVTAGAVLGGTMTETEALAVLQVNRL